MNLKKLAAALIRSPLVKIAAPIVIPILVTKVSKSPVLERIVQEALRTKG